MKGQETIEERRVQLHDRVQHRRVQLRDGAHGQGRAAPLEHDRAVLDGQQRVQTRASQTARTADHDGGERLLARPPPGLLHEHAHDQSVHTGRAAHG